MCVDELFPTASAESIGTTYVPKRLLLIGMCPVHTLLQAFPPECRVDHMLWESHPHSPLPEIDFQEYEGVIVGLTLRHILFAAASPSEKHWPSDVLWTRLVGNGQMQEYFDSCAGKLRERLAPLREWAARRPLLILPFIEPRENYLGLLFPRYSLDNPACFVQRLNQVLEETIAEWGNAWLIDVNEVLNAVGRLRIQDDYVNHLSHATYMFDPNVEHERDRQRIQPSTPPSELYGSVAGVREATGLIVKRIFDALKIIRGEETIKLIIIDLDDTLWRGIAADEERDIWGDPEGWPLAFAEALLVFKARGGLLAIVSKNDENDTLERLRSIHAGRLDAEDFVSIRINFEPKSRNVGEILADVNILPSNALFIDDNPREADEVRLVFPDLRVLSKEHFDWRRRILLSPETQVARLSAESGRRTENVQALIERERAKAALSREEWLASLELVQRHAVIRSVKDAHFPRAFELLNKTNQFNTTGRRWTHEELQSHFKTGGVLVCAFLRDRMVDNGLIGVVLLQNERIIQAVLSCRVFGLGAETAMLHAAMKLALNTQDHAVAHIEDSGKNFTCHRYFLQAGFEEQSEGTFIGREQVPYPAHIHAEWAADFPASDKHSRAGWKFPPIFRLRKSEKF